MLARDTWDLVLAVFINVIELDPLNTALTSLGFYIEVRDAGVDSTPVELCNGARPYQMTGKTLC